MIRYTLYAGTDPRAREDDMPFYREHLMAALRAHGIDGATITRAEGLWEDGREPTFRVEVLSGLDYSRALGAAARHYAERCEQAEVWITREEIGGVWKVRP